MASVALYADRSYSCGFEPTTQCKEVKADKIFLVWQKSLTQVSPS